MVQTIGIANFNIVDQSDILNVRACELPDPFSRRDNSGFLTLGSGHNGH